MKLRSFRPIDGCEGCASFAHQVFFTHDAIWDLCVPISMPPRTLDLCQYSYHELAYLHGLDKPRYQMPVTVEGNHGQKIKA